jgi:ribonuclease HI
MENSVPEVIIYTDGVCDPNPGPGGWAAVLRFATPAAAHEKVLTGAEPRTTNNRMELQAVIAALNALKKPCRVMLHTDCAMCKRASQNIWPVGK